MVATFDEHFQRAHQAREDREHEVARAAYEAALAVAVAPHEKALALDGLADTVFFVDDDKRRALELLDEAISTCLPQPDQDAPNDAATAYALAQSWFDKAIMLMMMSKDEDALAVFDESLRRLLDRATDHESQPDWNLELCVTVASTLRTKSTLLNGMRRFDEALACCDEVIRRFGMTKADKLLRRVASAMYRRSVLLGNFGRQDKEVEGYDELIARFGDSRNKDIIETVLDSFEQKTRIYQDQEDLDMVIETCDDLIRRYGEHSDWHVASSIARAMIRRAVALGKKGQHGKELAGYDTVVLRYGDSPEGILRRHAAKALMFKAVTLNDADQAAAEMECYEEVLRRYAEDADARVRAVAADALIHKGMSLATLAEDAGSRDIDPEIACYDEVVTRYGEDDSIDLMRAAAEALLHKAEALLEAGQASAGVACLEAVIEGYGSIKDGELREIVKDARAFKAEL